MKMAQNWNLKMGLCEMCKIFLKFQIVYTQLYKLQSKNYGTKLHFNSANKLNSQIYINILSIHSFID